MINEIFKYSKKHSKFNIFSQGGNPDELKQGDNNLYYRMCTSDKHKSYRVGFAQPNNNNKLILTITVNSKEKINIMDNAITDILSELNYEFADNTTRSKDKILKSRGIVINNNLTVQRLFALQENFLSCFEANLKQKSNNWLGCHPK